MEIPFSFFFYLTIGRRKQKTKRKSIQQDVMSICTPHTRTPNERNKRLFLRKFQPKKKDEVLRKRAETEKKRQKICTQYDKERCVCVRFKDLLLFSSYGKFQVEFWLILSKSRMLNHLRSLWQSCGVTRLCKRERETQRPNFLNIKSLPLDRRPSTGFSVAVDGAPGMALPPPPIIFWIKLGPVDCCCC